MRNFLELSQRERERERERERQGAGRDHSDVTQLSLDARTMPVRSFGTKGRLTSRRERENNDEVNKQ